MPNHQKGDQASDQILSRLQTLHPKSIDLTLGRIERLLGALGNPERKLPPVVHIAGTNGKGSTTAFLRAILEAAGFSVHVYTSPHLVRFNERIRIAGNIIEDDQLQDALERCERANAGEPITFFEITTAAAFVAFADTPADIVLLETGLGGRLDATNVIAVPRLTAITPISMDHEHFLGDDIESIAAEKAGIMKAGVPCLCAAQGSRKVERILKKAAEDLSLPLMREGKDWFMRFKGKDLSFVQGNDALALKPPTLAGRHQVQNAGLAIACARALAPDFDIPDAALALGL
ncbi:MAG: bifunctional folylpolyglutamate synthase/dihydrofolate synthase, partial [Rhodospirillaceae bacterium]|nr:bifunctional folylpolyglutamate synthase/dihydrofolate synthase [Rhodospirillaceae bacterium]